MQRSRLFDFAARGLVRIRWAASALLLLAVASSSFAQDYFTLPIDSKAAQLRGAAQQYLRNPAAADQAKFDEYFKNYYFPSMTRTEPEALGAIGKMREDLFKQWMFKATNPTVQQELTDLAFSEMGKVVAAKNPPAHPAARYNAILIIGQLDETYAPNGQQPPKPLPKATKALTAVVDSATAKDARFPPAIILGAIVGLERRAQLRQTLAPDEIAAMSAALMKLAAHDEPIQEMDPDAYSWMRLRAAEALAQFGSPGNKNGVHDAIIKLAKTGKSLDDRCAAAGLLEKIEYKNVKLDDAGTAEPLFALARDVAAAEDKRAQEFQDAQYTGGGISASPAPRGMSPGMESFGAGSLPAETYPRRLILGRLWDLRSGLKKVKPSLPEATQKKLDAVLAALNPAITAVSNKDVVELTLVQNMRTMADAIYKAVPAADKAVADKAKEDSAF
jgi:hypothetical protein